MKKIFIIFGFIACFSLYDSLHSAHCSGGHKEISDTKDTSDEEEKTTEKN